MLEQTSIFAIVFLFQKVLVIATSWQTESHFGHMMGMDSIRSFIFQISTLSFFFLIQKQGIEFILLHAW